MRVRAAVVIGMLLTAPAALHAQDCTIERSGETIRQGDLIAITFPVWVCPDGRRIATDYATFSEASGLLQLFGNVQFSDSARTLTSMNAQYFSRVRRLAAQGNVVLVHRSTNSVITGDQLEYLEATPQRESLVQAMGGRPRAILRQEVAGDSTILDAQLIEIIGEERMRGTGDASLTRDSVVAIGYVVDYEQGARILNVTGLGAHIEMPRYRLDGDSITAQLGEDDQITDLLTRHNASLKGEELNVTAPAVKLFFEGGGVTRMVAMNWEPRSGEEPGAQPRVENPEFNMVADSLDVLAPEQQITEAVAIGNAWGERVTPDSLRALLPEADPELMQLIANDWMRGDTVRAFFTENPAAAQDTAASARVMERLLASGREAQSMYRMRDDNAPTARLSINYLVGTAIDVRFRDGAVSEVSSPDARGVFLQPNEAIRRTPAAGGPGAGGRPGGAGGTPGGGGGAPQEGRR